MGLAKYAVKKTDNSKNDDKFFLIIGVLLIIAAIALTGYDIYKLTHYERVESKVVNVLRRSNGRHAHVTYEYDGKLYEDIALSYYDAFTMKTGKKHTVLINPAKPEKPHTTMFFMDVLLFLMGYLCMLPGLKKNNDKSKQSKKSTEESLYGDIYDK